MIKILKKIKKFDITMKKIVIIKIANSLDSLFEIYLIILS